MTRRLMAHRWARGSVLSALAALAVSAPAPASAAPPEKDTESLFYEGSARYSAADYDGAIDLWTKALTVITQEGGEYAVRGAQT